METAVNSLDFVAVFINSWPNYNRHVEGREYDYSRRFMVNCRKMIDAKCIFPCSGCREQIDKHEGELFVGRFGMQMMKSLL